MPGSMADPRHQNSKPEKLAVTTAANPKSTDHFAGLI
jgi:hypothetical protein